MEPLQIRPLSASLGRVDAHAAARARLLFSDRLAQGLGRWLPGAALRPAAAQPGGAPADGGQRFGLTLRGAGAVLELRVPWAVDAVTASILAAGSWSEEVRLACLFSRAATALDGLPAWLGDLGLAPERLDPDPGPLPGCDEGTAFEIRVRNHRIEGLLRCESADWMAQAARGAARLGAARLARVAGLPLPVSVVLGVRRLSLRLLRSLEPGDVLLLDRSGGNGPIGTAWLAVGRHGRGALGAACAVQGRDITITGDRWMNTETLAARRPNEQDGTGRHPGPAPGANPMADLEVELHVELQVLSTPLSELAAMRPGYVLELPTAAAEACVDLVVGGQVFGRAQLVSVGDRLGARILELNHDV